jgi:UDP-glucose 4-epimerase
VTGGAGFIGSALARACVEAGEQVCILDDFSSGRMENLSDIRKAIDLIRGSVVDFETVQQALRGCEIVFHLAARPSVTLSVEAPLQTHAVNVNGTLHVLEAARCSNVRRVVFASSCALYGDSDSLPLAEDLPPSPLSPYGLHKLAGELYCQQFTRHYGLETVALRYFNVFGPLQDSTSSYAAVIPLFMAAVARFESPTIYGDGLQARDFIHVDDVVAATRAAAAASSEAVGKVFNVGRGDSMSVLELFERICKVADRTDLKPVFAPARAGDIRESQADISKTKRVLGWRPRLTIEEGLLHTTAKLRAGGRR